MAAEARASTTGSSLAAAAPLTPVTARREAVLAEAGEPRWAATIRRGRDVTGAALALVLLAPVMAIIAVAIRLNSPGPAVFRQQRLGRGMRPFTVLKFRTMWSDSDTAPHREYVSGLIAGSAGAPREG